MSDESDSPVDLDDVDRGILFALQRDARNATTTGIGEEVGVSASTVRNRIERMEEAGVIEGYVPKIDYERAGFPLHVLFVCTAGNERTELAEQALGVPGVIDVREMLTSVRNVYVEAVGTDTRNVAAITDALSDLGLSIVSSEIVTGHRVQPFGPLEF